MVRNLFASLSFLTLLVSCIGTNAGVALTYRVDPAFTPAETNLISHALSAWSTASVFRLQRSPDGSYTVLKMDPGDGFTGYYEVHRKVIKVHPRLDGDSFARVILHEVGHSIGVGHTVSGVMTPDAEIACITKEDYRECERVGACGETGRHVLCIGNGAAELAEEGGIPSDSVQEDLRARIANPGVHCRTGLAGR